jgi:DNA-binding NtrC family response regulator
MQAKLLRVLQERVVTPLGGKPVSIDVRVIAATHRDLQHSVRTGSFREDLYYRLGVVPLALPPLRERLADILPLAEHFLAQFAGTGKPKRISSDAAASLLAHAWPGNVRELLNAIQRAATFTRRLVLVASDFHFLSGSSVKKDWEIDWLAGSLPDAVERIEIAMIKRAMEETNGNRTHAAERLGIRRQLLHQKLARYGLE